MLVTLLQFESTALSSAASNPFGLIIGGPNMLLGQRLNLASRMGAAYFRPWDVTIEGWNGTCPDCDALRRSGLKIVLTVRNNGNNNTTYPSPSNPPADLDTYERRLGDILDKYVPEVLVVENEENSDLFYSGTPDQYGVELTVACDAAHRKNVPCTNGGIVSRELALLTWANYLDSGQRQQACDFARRALPGPEGVQLCSITSTASLPPRVHQNLEEGRALVQVYKASGIDYVNFHWYIADPQALREATAYLTAATGLPLLSNEIGQIDSSPDTVSSLMSGVLDLNLPVAVWFSLDRQARSLVEPDGTLRPNGEAFARFIRERFGPAGPPQPPANRTFSVGAPFADYYSRYQGPKVLGPPVGPLLGRVQYFEKGRLEDTSGAGRGAWAYSYGLLVPELIRGGAAVRIAGASGPTYAELAPKVAPTSRVKAPGGRSGLISGADGSAFVPFDPFLRGDAGHSVPAYFWSYMNDGSLFPAGWLHDIGLPLSEPFTAEVNKAGSNRQVTLQVFERTILSYDPANPASFQVERANTGLAYRDAFPARVLSP